MKTRTKVIIGLLILALLWVVGTLTAHTLSQEAKEIRTLDQKAWERSGTKVVMPLAELLQYDSDANIRSRAAESLGIIGDSRAVPALVDALDNDHETYVRFSAAEALGKIKDKRAADALYAHLRDRKVGGSCLRALGELKDVRAVKFLVKSSKDFPFEYFDVFRSVGEPALPYIVPKYSRENLRDITGLIIADKYGSQWAKAPVMSGIYPEKLYGKVIVIRTPGNDLDMLIYSRLDLNRLPNYPDEVSFIVLNRYSYNTIGYYTPTGTCKQEVVHISVIDRKKLCLVAEKDFFGSDIPPQTISGKEYINRAQGMTEYIKNLYQ